MSKVGRNDPCPCGSGLKHKKCCDGKPPGRPLDEDAPALTLLIETDRGDMLRRIPNAAPLRSDLKQGPAAEAAAQDAAAVYGMPDFVFRPEVAHLDSGTREVGDGIIVVGDLGIVLQVKSREQASGESAKEARWLRKKTTEALRQANGTLRTLLDRQMWLTNLRGARVAVDGKAYRWVLVVVLDHPDPPEDVVPSLDAAKHPAVTLVRRDWEFLFDQLKSTYAVAEYCHRVADEGWELGTEPLRYYDLAQEDAATPPEVLPDELVGHFEQISCPLLPLAPAAIEDRSAHRMVRVIFEDIAVTRLTSSSEADRLRILGELDRLPVGQRAQVGTFVLDAMKLVSEHDGDGIVWRMRSVRGTRGRTHLGFGACSHPYTSEIAEGFSLWVQLRHHDLVEATGKWEGLTTVATLVTPRDDAARPWDTTVAAVSGPTSFTPADLRQLRQLWPGPARLPIA